MVKRHRHTNNVHFQQQFCSSPKAKNEYFEATEEIALVSTDFVNFHMYPYFKKLKIYDELSKPVT